MILLGPTTSLTGNPTDVSARHSDQLPCRLCSFPNSCVITALLETSLPGLLPFGEGNPGFNLSPKPPLRPSGSSGKGWFICWRLSLGFPVPCPPCHLTEQPVIFTCSAFPPVHVEETWRDLAPLTDGGGQCWVKKGGACLTPGLGSGLC